MDKHYRVILKTTTKVGPLAVDSERSFHMKLSDVMLSAIVERCHALGWSITAVPFTVREWDSVEKAFNRTIELDTDI